MTIKLTVFKGSPSGKIVESQTILPNVSQTEVLIKHTHSGVCGTDTHYLHTDMVLGHEGVGIVQEIGSEIKTVKM